MLLITGAAATAKLTVLLAPAPLLICRFPVPAPTPDDITKHTCVSVQLAIAAAAAPFTVTVPCTVPKLLPVAHCFPPTPIGLHCTELIVGRATTEKYPPKTVSPSPFTYSA